LYITHDSTVYKTSSSYKGERYSGASPFLLSPDTSHMVQCTHFQQNTGRHQIYIAPNGIMALYKRSKVLFCVSHLCPTWSYIKQLPFLW